MIEAFIHGRKFAYSAKAIDKENDNLFQKLKADYIRDLEKEAAMGERESSKPSPGMLPSPESIAGTSSANSTPSSNRPDSAPSNSVGSSRAAAAAALLQNRADLVPPAHYTIPVNTVYVAARKTQSGGLLAARYAMENSQRFLTLPVIAKHFPRTFSRVVYSTYSATDEHEPDIEDEEGELFWPGQLATGEGLGWVCTMGKAMIKEFGKNYHYQGLDGVIPKPAQVETPTPTPAGPAAPSTASDPPSSSVQQR